MNNCKGNAEKRLELKSNAVAKQTDSSNQCGTLKKEECWREKEELF
jgi:hypothetical protein